jgi:PAS domain S-box-containing protein
MKDELKTKKQLVDELTKLRSQLAEASLRAAEPALRESEEEERRFQQRLRILIEVSNELSKAESVDSLCRRAVELGRERLGFDRLGIWFRSDVPDVIVGSFGVDEEGNLRDERGKRVTVTEVQRDILSQQAPSALLFVDQDLVGDSGNVVGRGIRTQAAMWDGEAVIGFISTDNLLQRRPITERDCELLNLYASTLGYLCSRKRAEEALVSERAVLRTLIDLLPEVVYAKDLEARKTLANYIDLQYMGAQSEAEVLGKTDFDFYPEDVATKFYADDQIVLQTGQSVLNREEVIVRGGDERRWLLTSKVPLRDESGRVIGLVGVGRDFTERKQAEEAMQRYIGRLRTLRAIDGVILSGRSPKDIARVALRHLQNLIPYERASITAFDFEAGQASILAVKGIGEEELGSDTQISLEEVGNLEELQRAKIVTVEDMRALLPLSPLNKRLLALGILARVVIPLMVEGKLIGMLELGGITAHAFTSDHQEIAHESAGQLAIGIQQARLREQVQRHAEELEQQVAARTAQLARRTVQLQAAAEVARDATTAHDLDDLLNRAADLICERFGFYHAGIFLTDERGEYAVLRAAASEAGRQMLEHGHKLKVGEVGMVGYVAGTGEPRIALDVGADAVHFDNPFLPETRSEMALPMRAGGRVIGALDVQSRKEAAFDQDDVEILQVMADQLAVAIERTRLFERAQATLEERLYTVISKMPIVLCALDRQGVFTLSEGKGLEALGLKPGEHVGRSSLDVYRDAPEVLEDFRRALAGEVVTSIRERAGLIFEAWYSPLRDESGEITGVIGVATDVTERHRLQEQMQRQERLAAVGQLAGGIAHDFNNFLMTIIFYAHLLLRDKDTSPDIASIAETIVGEANRAAALVRQVLDFSRRSVMNAEPINLASFIEEAVDILRKTFPENIQLVTEVGPGDYTVNADSTRIQQVVMNLALNARDAMHDGGELHIGLSRITIAHSERLVAGASDVELSAGDWVCLAVSDTGTGMTEQVRAHLFEPFFTTKGPKGTGLGLAQVYGIVKQHKGDVGVETAPGRGTTFRVYLPAWSGGEMEATLVEETPGVLEGRGETILLVEDEETVREAGQKLLTSLGYQVLTASNGREGLEVFRAADHVDLVLTDMVMPEMGGRELIQELKQSHPYVKALVITGYTMQEDVQVLKESGFTDVVYKPLDIGVLGRTIRRILDANSEDDE